MKLVYQCDWCGERGTEKEIREHEANCIMNKALRSCYTCGNRKGFGITRMDCQLDKEIPEGKYFQGCPDWVADEQVFDTKNPYSSIFDCFFGKPPKSKE